MFQTTREKKIFLVILVATVVADAFIMAFDLSLSALDARLYYRVSDVSLLMTTLQEDGRRSYFVLEVMDLGLILLYSTLLFKTTKMLSSPSSRRFTLPSIVPLLPGMFDLCETLGILYLLTIFPFRGEWSERLVQVSTPLKWTALFVSIANLVYRWWRWSRLNR